MSRPVVVTGVGMVTPVGHDAETTWRALRDGKSGVGGITAFSTEKRRSDIASLVKDYDAQ